MTIRALVIGIGSGNVDHLTREAVTALNEVDVFLVADKGRAKHDLVELRTELCRAVIEHDRYRVVEVPEVHRALARDVPPVHHRDVELAHPRLRRQAEGVPFQVAAEFPGTDWLKTTPGVRVR